MGLVLLILLILLLFGGGLGYGAYGGGHSRHSVSFFWWC